MSQRKSIYVLEQIVQKLTGKEGCPWDKEQTHESLKRHLLEECYEFLEAIDLGDSEKLLDREFDKGLAVNAAFKAREKSLSIFVKEIEFQKDLTKKRMEENMKKFLIITATCLLCFQAKAIQWAIVNKNFAVLYSDKDLKGL